MTKCKKRSTIRLEIKSVWSEQFCGALKAKRLGSVAKFDFSRKIEFLVAIDSMTYRIPHSSKTNFATEPSSVSRIGVCRVTPRLKVLPTLLKVSSTRRAAPVAVQKTASGGEQKQTDNQTTRTTPPRKPAPILGGKPSLSAPFARHPQGRLLKSNRAALGLPFVATLPRRHNSTATAAACRTGAVRQSNRYAGCAGL